MGLSKWADQSLCVDVQTEAIEGKKLVQGHAGSSCQRSRMRPPLFGDSKRGKGLMGLGEREADDQTNLELRLKA